jgi:hypothetical protein
MPIKLSVGLSRKIGEPHYCSRGASVGLEVESDVDVIRDPPRLEQHLAYLFRLANQSLDQQLSGQPTALAQSTDNRPGSPCRTKDRPATRRQIRAMHAIADRLELDLVAELEDRFGRTRPTDLSIGQASELIGAWKAASNGRNHGDEH